MSNLYDVYIRKLVEVNDESKTDLEHNRLCNRFYGWIEGIRDATGRTFNGDYFYIELEELGEMEERPMCCGVFLDWKSNAVVKVERN